MAGQWYMVSIRCHPVTNWQNIIKLFVLFYKSSHCFTCYAWTMFKRLSFALYPHQANSCNMIMNILAEIKTAIVKILFHWWSAPLWWTDMAWRLLLLVLNHAQMQRLKCYVILLELANYQQFEFGQFWQNHRKKIFIPPHELE